MDKVRPFDLSNTGNINDKEETGYLYWVSRNIIAEIPSVALNKKKSFLIVTGSRLE